MTTLRNRITNLLPGSSTLKNVTTRQLLYRLNKSTANPPVAPATVRGRLSELVRDGVVATETRASGRTGFFRIGG